MRNPLFDSNEQTRIERLLAKCRAVARRLSGASGGRDVSRKWLVGLLLSAALLGGISLGARAKVPGGKDSRNSGGDVTSAGKSEASASSAAIPGKPASKTRAASASPTGNAAAKPPKAARPGAAGGSKGKAGKGNSESATQSGGQDVSSSGVLKPEEEGSDLILRRAQWFHDQRAYPFAHIPPGAYQKALQQRDAMLQRQHLSNFGKLNAQAVITFPGDGLWHLMGPQPTNRPFGNISGLGNSGFPTSSGRITAIAIDPSDTTGNTVYVGGAAGGVWKTTDGGNTWTPLTDFQPSLAVGSITIDPNNNQAIYVGTGEDNFNLDGYYGAGILKSTNGGATWTQLGASVFAGAKASGVGGGQIGAIAVQPGNSQILLAAVTFFDGNDPSSGIWRSADGGTTWTRPTTGAQGSAGTGVVFDPAGSLGTTATVYAALGDIFSPSATNNGVWKSTDSGANWTKLGGGLPTSNVGRITLGYAAGTTGATATIYAAIADSSTNNSATLLGLFKTANAGTTWTQLGSAPNFCDGAGAGTGQCFYDMAIGVDPRSANNVVVGGGAFSDNFTSLFESKDGGATWTGTAGDDFSGPVTGTHPHVDTHALVFTPSSETFRLYVGNDGGLWRTDTPTPSGVSPTWVDGNAGLALTQFYPGPTAAIGDENSGFGGSQDNDTQEFTGTLDWTGVDACGDGGFTAIDNQYPTTIYTACAPGSGPGLVMKSVFNGGIVGGNPTFSPADTGIASENSLFIPPLAIDDATFAPNLYYGTCHVFQSTNGGASWTAITGDLPSGTNTLGAACGGAGSITNFDIAHSNTSVVVAATSNGKIWETLNGAGGPASTWTEIDNLVAGQLPPRNVTAVRTKRGDSSGQIVYATFSGFGSCGGCDGKGHVFKTANGGTAWTDISGDLPDTPVNDIIVDHNGNAPAFDALYIATDVGVFSCPNPEASPACSNWTIVGDGLPNSPVLGLAMRRSSRILHAATHGRSMWDIQLRDEQPPALAALNSLTPAAVLVGAATTNVTVTGVNFSTNTQVLFDGVSVGTPTFVNSTQLTVAVNANMFQAGIVYAVTVSDLAGADTGSLPFTVMNPILTATNMTPSSTTAGTAVTLVFTGTNFVSDGNGLGGTAVTFNNVQLFGGTASAGGTSFSVQVPVQLLLTAGPATVTITNSLPGGGPTPPISFPFTINPGTILFNPNPIALGTFLNTTSTVLNVAIINTSAASATITAQSITGTNAANFSFAAPLFGTTCNFPSSGQVGTGSVTLAANGGTCNFGITYFANPASPGNAVSNATLSVADNASGSPQSAPIQGTPFPTVVVLSPVIFGNVVVGTTSPTMNATLTNGTAAPVNVTSGFSIAGTNAGDFHIVSFVSNGDPNSACPAAPFALPPAPAAGSACDVSLTFTPSLPPSSETAQLNVTASVAVTTSTPNLFGIGIEITSISPEIVATGGPAFTLTVNGGGFASSAVVNVNGSARLTTFVSANQLKASIPASDIATAGSLAISVTTPNPGGTTSEPKTLIVAQAEPATNDNVNFAVAVLPANLPFRITQDTTQATTQSVAFTGSPATPVDPLPCASGSKAKSVWFTFTPTASGKVVADTRFSSYTTILSSWTISTPLPSSTATFAPVACSTGNVPASGSAPAASLSTFPVTSGTTYYLMVTDGGGTGAGGTLTLSLDFAAPPAPTNDNNATPTVIAAAPFSNTENTIEATANTGGNTDPTPPCTVGAAGLVGTGQANSVWYEYTPTSNGTITADTLTSPYITILNVTSGSPTGTQIACNQSASAGIAQSQVSFAATSGTQYFFMVSSFLGDGGTTNFHLTFNATTVGPATKLAFTQEPTNVAAGASIAPAVTVTIQDASGNTVTTATNQVTVAILNNAGGGTLSGTLTQSPTNGVATFSNLSINKAGTGYTLTASATSPPALTSANSTAFNVTAGGAATVTATSGTPQSVPITKPFAAFVATVTDSGGNPVGGVVVTFTPPASGASGTFAGGVNTATTNGSGVATSAIFTANSTVGGPYNVVASATGATSANFVLTNLAGPAATVSATGGTPQSVAITKPFAAFVATVTDSGGNPVSGVVVTFTPPASGASGTFAGGVNTATTNASGVATSAIFTANSTAGGPYNVVASATGATSANFVLTNLVGPAATVSATSGTPQSVAITKPFAAFVATVTDSGGNPVSGVVVTFTPPASGASGTFAGGVNTATTNASGVATSAIFTANGTAGGPYNVVASATGATSANFALTNLSGTPATVAATGGTPQSVPIDKPFAAFVVTVTDSSSNPVSGVIVTFTPPASGASGTFAGGVNTATTNASGVATSAIFTANGTAGGPYNVVASAAGAASANFVLTNLVGAAATVTATSGTPQSVAITKPFAAFVATVTDSGGNPVSGVVVTFTPPASGASGTFAGGVNTATTNASGVATSAIFTANSTAGGPYNVVASATGATSANFVLTNLAGPAAAVSATSGTPQSVAITKPFAAFVATVTDSGGNPVSGVVVTFTPPASGASGTFAGGVNTATTNASGVATSAIFTANSTVGGPYNVVASATGATSANFVLTNTAGPPATITAVSGTPQTVALNTAFATLQAVVKDAGGNLATGVPVTFTAPSSGASGTFANGTNTVTVNTDNTGTASATTFTANFTNGAYNVNATVSGVNAPAPFALTNTANAPTLTSPLTPASATAGGAGFVLTVNGTNFATTSVVSFNGVAMATTFVSGTQLTANITAAAIATAGNVNVSVTTPAPGGGTSGILPFAINNPVPTTTTLSPTSTTAGGAGFNLTVTGTNLLAASVVNFNGAAKATTFNPATPTQLTAAITAADIANGGVVSVTVTNPAPGGGTSSPALQFTINNVQPVLTTLSPTSKLAGSGAFTLTVNGNAGSFVKGAVVTFNGIAETTTFVTSSQLTANINAPDIATAGNLNVIVTNPAPSVGPSTALTFMVNNPVPTISAATAGGQNHVAGGAGFTLTVTGTNFVTGTNEASVISFNGKAEPTTFVSGTQITAAIPATDVATAGSANVSVTNPGPGGGPTPTTIAFTIDGYALAGPGSTVTVKAGIQAVFPITITPTANGFANAVVFSVSGLPAHASLEPLTVPNVTTKATVNLTIDTTSRGAAPPTSPLDQPLPPAVRFLVVTWLCAMLAGIYAVIMIRRRPQLRRFAVLVPLVLLLLSGAVLAGCASGMNGTPAGTFQLTVTATSGTLSQSTPATLTVQ